MLTQAFLFHKKLTFTVYWVSSAGLLAWFGCRFCVNCFSFPETKSSLFLSREMTRHNTLGRYVKREKVSSLFHNKE